MSKRDKTDNAWVIFLILAIMFFWAAWLAADSEGHWHVALTIWAGTCFVICLIGLVVNLIIDYF